MKTKTRNTWVHVGTESDGRWVKGFVSQKAATDSLREYCFYSVPKEFEVEPDKTYHSDLGGPHYIKELPAGMTTAIYRRLLIAYDAREINDITAHQSALLTWWGW